jgi:hypothetical protein
MPTPLQLAQALEQQQQPPAPYSSFHTPLSAGQQMAMSQWAARNGVPFDPSQTADYDMRGFYRALMAKDPRATAAVNPNDQQMHYPDYWKTPYHQSFSNESKWAQPGAPMWNAQDQLEAPSGRIMFDERKRR